MSAAGQRTIRLQELVGRTVRTSEGRRLGRVYDVVADKRGEDLCVTGVLIGPSVWLERFGWTRRLHGREIAWEELAAIGPDLRLRSSTET